ncbi:MAG TPA: pyruvate kinase [Candidatus Avacidaminococcus intestinavium]|uniref:Pyruvate kinase n=1 Tax=Candidatus Avacidaminococcus intestinavium TaxID=2840684 RepID=A0A9D1MNW9_9FIRM|nr:pyruvate kinase [Candidatus Avacidaminococcus intestinavium]
MKKTKIICTLGPATENIQILTEMLKSGMDLARFNFSHGSHEGHAKMLELLHQAAVLADKEVATVADTKGPEMRLGLFKDNQVELVQGETFTLTTDDIVCTKDVATVNYSGLPKEVKSGDAILLADGMIALKVDKVVDNRIITKVVHGGVVSSRKRVAAPGVQLNLPFISEEDKKDIEFAVSQNMDYIAASFVQTAADVLAIRKLVEDLGADIGIIAKIENHAGVCNIESIINVSDGIMIARGDLGVELAAERVPLVQKEIIKLCNKAGKPVITATQMLESMINSYRATRAEASDIANAIFDGTDAIMLSGETASGKYPLEAVRTMSKIAVMTEEALDYVSIFQEKGIGKNSNTTDAISHATVQIAEELEANAVLTITESGYTARMTAKYRPASPVIAVSPRLASVRKMQLYWGVTPLQGQFTDKTDELIELSLLRAKTAKLIREGDLVVVTAGVSAGIIGSTNLIKVINVGKIILSGVGIGKRSVIGKVCIAKSLKDVQEKFQDGDILVVHGLGDEMARYAVKAAAIIAEEGGLTSSAAILGISYGIPVVIGVEDVLSKLQDGSDVTVDSANGRIFQGKINIK